MNITILSQHLRKCLLGGFLVVAFAVQGMAVDRYALEIPSSVMVGGSPTLIKVIPLASGEVDPIPHLVQFIGLPTGVRIDPVAPSSSLVVSGPTQFNLSLDPTLVERRVLVRVQKSGTPKVNGGGFLNVDRPVSVFSITPAGMTSPRVGIPFRFQVIALDREGAVVRSYKDPVDLRVDIGEVQDSLIEGAQFTKGVAFVDLMFSEATPPERMNRLEAQARNLYAGQAERAAGFVDLMVEPRGSGR